MVRTTRFLFLILTAAFGVNFANAQTVNFKNFNSFRNIVPGVDFFASNRQTIAPYEEASAEAVAKLKYLLGEEIPKGAIFICSNLAQKDSLYEPGVLKQGYSWVLVSTTPEVRIQEQMERIKSQIGDNIPEEMRQRMNNMMNNMPRDMMRDMTSNAERQAASAMARDIAFAVLQVMVNDENFNYRSSRVDDVSKSPLQDWLDIGIGAYASEDKSAVRYLRENLDMAFPIEDVLFMARPFVASNDASGRTGGGAAAGGGFPGGGFPGGQGQRQGAAGGAPKSKPDGGQQRTMSKDEQDRMLFDGQAISFFDYFLEKFGIEKMRELIEFASEKNESWDYIVRPDIMGRDFTKIEKEWTEWLMKQPVPDPKPKPKAQ